MLKKTITYEDFNGETITEDFYFNLSKAELVELQLGEKHGFAEHLQTIAASEDGRQIVETFKKMILLAYGQKSSDGRRFIKNEQLREEFSQTEAFSNLFVELATDAEAAAAFANGILPSGLLEAAKERQKSGEITKTDGTKFEDYTRDQLLGMTDEQFKALLPADSKLMTNEQLLIAFQRKLGS